MVNNVSSQFFQKAITCIHWSTLSCFCFTERLFLGCVSGSLIYKLPWGALSLAKVLFAASYVHWLMIYIAASHRLLRPTHDLEEKRGVGSADGHMTLWNCAHFAQCWTIFKGTLEEGKVSNYSYKPLLLYLWFWCRKGKVYDAMSLLLPLVLQIFVIAHQGTCAGGAINALKHHFCRYQ